MEELLLNHLGDIHTTKLGTDRIKKNLGLDTDDVAAWCVDKIRNSQDVFITKKGKNWYVGIDDFVITINTSSYTIITAHKQK